MRRGVKNSLVSYIYNCKASGKWFFAISYPKLRPYWQNCQSWVGKPLAWQQPWAWETQTTKKCMNLYVCLTTFWLIYLSIKISFSRVKLMVCIPCMVYINPPHITCFRIPFTTNILLSLHDCTWPRYFLSYEKLHALLGRIPLCGTNELNLNFWDVLGGLTAGGFRTDRIVPVIKLSSG